MLLDHDSADHAFSAGISLLNSSQGSCLQLEYWLRLGQAESYSRQAPRGFKFCIRMKDETQPFINQRYHQQSFDCRSSTFQQSPYLSRLIIDVFPSLAAFVNIFHQPAVRYDILGVIQIKIGVSRKTLPKSNCLKIDNQLTKIVKK